MRRFFAMAAALLATATGVAGTSSPIGQDPPADSANPASLVELTLPSHGAQLLGALYTPAGPGPHPAAIIFHGFPGYEQNLDVAQTLRRAGYVVLAAHYRGSWGIPGTFSFTHAIEDADAEVDWITSSDAVAKCHIDPSRVVVIGHSMGGYMALSAAAHHPAVLAAVSISGASLGHRFAGRPPGEREKLVAEYTAHVNPVDLLPLAGTSTQALGVEIFEHRAEWDFQALASSLGSRPVLLITADDGTGPNSAALLKTLEAAGATRSRHVRISTDHPFSDHRVALQENILRWLDPLVAAGGRSSQR